MLQLYRPVLKETNKALLFEICSPQLYGEQYYSPTTTLHHTEGTWKRNFDAVYNQYIWTLYTNNG